MMAGWAQPWTVNVGVDVDVDVDVDTECVDYGRKLFCIWTLTFSVHYFSSGLERTC